MEIVRDDAFVRKMRMWIRLQDGRSRTTNDFEDIRIDEGVIKKTIKRDLEALARIKEAAIIVYSQNRTYYYRSTQKHYDEQKSKKCRKCKQLKPLTEEYFYYSKVGIGGLDDWCILCVRKRTLKWQKENGAKKRMYQRRWYKRNKERVNAKRRERYLNGIINLPSEPI
jgi:hypothetical protein